MNLVCTPEILASLTLFTRPGVKRDCQSGFPDLAWNFLAFYGFKPLCDIILAYFPWLNFWSGVVTVLSPLGLLSLVIFTLRLHKQLRIIEAERLFNKKENALLNLTGSKSGSMDLKLSWHSNRTVDITLCCFHLQHFVECPSIGITHTWFWIYIYCTVD